MALSKPRKTLAACCGVHAIHDGISDILYVLLPLLKLQSNLRGNWHDPGGASRGARNLPTTGWFIGRACGRTGIF